MLEFYQEPETESESEKEEVLREYETIRNTMINKRQVHFRGLSKYNTGSDLFYQMSNATFGDLAGVPKYRRQMQEAIIVVERRIVRGKKARHQKVKRKKSQRRT